MDYIIYYNILKLKIWIYLLEQYQSLHLEQNRFKFISLMYFSSFSFFFFN